MPDFSIADILARGYQGRKDLLTQPYGPSNALPMAGNLINQGFQTAEDQQKKRSVIQAQQDYAQFLSTPENQRDPMATQRGIQAGLALGITPPQAHQKSLSEIELEAAARAKGTSSVKPSISEDQKIKNIEEESAARTRGTTKGGALDQNSTEKFAQMLASGTPSNQVSQALGRSGAKSLPAIYKRAFELKPDLKIDSSQLDYQTKLALNKTNMGATIQLPARKIAAIIPRIDSAVEASNKVPRTSLQLINKLGIAGAAKVGNREAQDLLNKAKLVADEFQSTIGSGSDSKLDLALDLLNTSQTIEQFQDAARNMKDAMNARREAILTGAVPGESGKTQNPIETRTLKDGSTVKVQKQPDGTYHQVE